MNFSDIAKELGISRKTAYRYWQKWKQTEEAQMVDWEWWELYKKVKVVNPEKALECLTRIKHKMIVERAEVKQEIREISLKWDMPYEPNSSSEVQAAP
jgi:transposase